MRARYVTSWMASIGIIALWFFPVAFVRIMRFDTVFSVEEILSHLLHPTGRFIEQCQPIVRQGHVRCLPMIHVVFQVTRYTLYFCRWLTWVCRAPPPIPGIIQGILPPLFLAILFAVLPWILRGACMHARRLDWR